MRRVGIFPQIGDYNEDKQNIAKSLLKLDNSFPLKKGEEIYLENISTGSRIINHKLRRLPKGVMEIKIPNQAVYTITSWTAEIIVINVTTAGNLRIWVG